MKRARKQSGIGCLVALLLTACGGGGGGSSGFTSPGAANVRALDPARARTYFRGSTAPGRTASLIHSEIEQLVGRIQGHDNRSLLVSDISLFTTSDGLNLPARRNTVCQGMACAFTLSGTSLSITTEDFSLGSAASLRPVMRHRGILLTGGGEAIRTSEEAPNYPGWIDFSRFPVVSVSGGAFSYGGWLDHSAFLVEGRSITSGNSNVSLYYGQSFGIASNSRPTGVSARWNGVMVATDVSGPGRENIIQGDAALSVDFGAVTVDLSFSNVRDLTTGATRTGTAWSGMPVTVSGTFSGTNPQGETAGRFYGPGHEEAGGTFTYADLAGAYGLKRRRAGNVGALDLARARTYFTGSTAPGGTVSQIHSEIEQLVGRIQGSVPPPPPPPPPSPSRSLLVSDISLFTTRDDLNLPVRLNTTCQIETCNFRLLEEVRTISVADFSLAPAATLWAATLRPVMRYRGILLAGWGEADEPGWLDYSRFPVPVVSGDMFGYGGWLDYSGFLVESLPITEGDARDVSLYFGRSIGIASNSRPTGGDASWNGVMVAMDVSGPGRGNIIQGDAALSVDFGAATADLSFSNVRDLTAGTTRTGTAWNNMPVTASGTFSGTNPQGETTGRFYGPEHQEAGGTFTYDDLAGAYGLKRQ